MACKCRHNDLQGVLYTTAHLMTLVSDPTHTLSLTLAQDNGRASGPVSLFLVAG